MLRCVLYKITLLLYEKQALGVMISTRKTWEEAVTVGDNIWARVVANEVAKVDVLGICLVMSSQGLLDWIL